MVGGGRKKKIPLREWRIWPFLTACTGTQLAYAIMHVVVNDSFACVLTLFSFIGSLCCIISRRSEVVVANLLLQIVAFFTLFICCCLGTSSMQMWHDNKKLVPLIATQILFFAALLVLNAILLALKKRQGQHDAAEEPSVFGNWRKPFGGKAESSASAFPRSTHSSRTFFRLHQQREEQQAQSEQAQNQQIHTCRTRDSTCGDKPRRAGVNVLHVNSSHDVALRDPSSGYAKEISGTNQESSDALHEDEAEDDEADHAVTMGRAARPVCERFAASPHLVIRSQQIEAAGGTQHYSVRERSATCQAFAARAGRTSSSSATPVIHQQSCILHGRALHSGFPVEVRASDRGRRTSQGVDASAAPWSPTVEGNAAAAIGGMGVFVVNYERQQKATNAPIPLCPPTPRRCQNGHFVDKNTSCSCPLQTSGPCPFSSASSQHSCVSLHDGATGCGATSLEQNDLFYRPPSTGVHKYVSTVTITKTVRRCWETTLNYLSRAVDCDAVTEATKNKAQELHQRDLTPNAISSRTTAGDTATNVEGSIEGQPPREIISRNRSLYHCRRASVDNSKPRVEAVGGARSTCTESKDKRKDPGLENEDEGMRKPSFSGIPPEQKLVIAQHGNRENNQTQIGGVQSPPVPLGSTLEPFDSMQHTKNGDSCTDPPTLARQDLAPTANEGSVRRGEEQEANGNSWTAEVYTEPEQQILAKQGGHQQEDGEYHSSSAKPTNTPAAAELSTENMLSSREIGGEVSCSIIKVTPASTKEKSKERQNEEMQLDAGSICEGASGTTGKQRRPPAVETGKRGQILGYTAQSVSREGSAWSDDELTQRSRSVEVLSNRLETASVLEVTKGDTLRATSQLDHNHIAKCKVVSNHRAVGTAFIKGVNGTLQGTTPFETGDAMPLSGSFNRLPASTVPVGEDRTSSLMPSIQVEARDAQQSPSETTVGNCSQSPSLNCPTETAGRVGGPLPSAEQSTTIDGVRIPCANWGNEHKIGGVFLGDEVESRSGARQSCSIRTGCAPSAGVSAAPAGGETYNERCVRSSKSDRSSIEAIETRGIIVGRPSSGITDHGEAGEGVDALCMRTDVHPLNVRTAAEARSVTSNELRGRSAHNFDKSEVAKYSVNRTAVNLDTTAAGHTGDMPLTSTARRAATTEGVPSLGGTRLSREKVVYRDNLTRELTLNTTPRAEEEEDSWEDESEESEGQNQDDRLTGKDSEREGRSEWELSDLSDAGTHFEKRRQRRGMQKHQKSRGNSSAESSEVSGKNSARRTRNYRRIR